MLWLLTDVLQRVDYAPDLVVGLRGEGGEGLHQPRRDLLLVRRQRVPGGNFGGPRRQLRIGRNDAQLQLALKRLLAVLVPALVELALELVDPGLRDVVRRMRRAGRVVDEERPVGRRRLLLVDIFDRLVGQIFVQRVVPSRPVGTSISTGSVSSNRAPAATGSASPPTKP